MTIREVAAALGAEILHDEFTDAELTGAYTSDLLSDVMANAKDGGALITIQAHKNSVAVASLVEITVIIVCNSRPIPEDFLASAKDEGVALLLTKENQFTVSGKLYALLNSKRSGNDAGQTSKTTG
jgi:serine kinase of HPr protein (carbohydrate metabolism regulator)